MDRDDAVSARQIDRYNEAADKYGVSSKAVLWEDQQSQYLRFAELVKPLDFNDPNKTLLDVGCGNGELYKYLNFVGYRGRYVGFDINDKLLTQARRRFAGIDVRNINILYEDAGHRFDYAVLSGLFNVNAGQSEEWVYTFLKKMFGLCEGIMVFNMISTHVTFRDEGMFYMNPAEVLTFCIENLSRRTMLAHHNLPYNFTVAVFRQELWKSARERFE